MLIESQVAGLACGGLSSADPLLLNLAVARGVPSLAGLDAARYARQADEWAAQIRARLPGWEREFRRSPQDWNGNVHLFRMGMACCFVHHDLGVRYKDDQKDAATAAYTDPSDLFLNGVMDTRRGTCASMAALHVALGRRLGWPVSLALAGWHCLLRYDDGRLRFNVAATNTEGGFRSHPDDWYRREYRVPDDHVACGSDLATLGPRQLLGHFLGCRGRHGWDVGEYGRAADDFGAALALFPESRLYRRMLGQCACAPVRNKMTVSAWR